MIRGIDVSSVQGVIDWQNVSASGTRFAIMKCAQGNESGRDSTYASNVAGAVAAGLVVGCYLFAYPLGGDKPGRNPAEQAKIHFDKADGVGTHDGELPPALDLEWPAPEDWGRWQCNAAQIRDWGLAYLDAARALWGRAPLVYTYPWFWDHIRASGSIDRYAEFPLWLADYSASAECRAPAPWKAVTLRQTSGGGGRLPNGARVDEDAFYGDEAAWRALLRLKPDVTDGGNDAPVYAAPEPTEET